MVKDRYLCLISLLILRFRSPPPPPSNPSLPISFTHLLRHHLQCLPLILSLTAQCPTCSLSRSPSGTTRYSSLFPLCFPLSHTLNMFSPLDMGSARKTKREKDKVLCRYISFIVYEYLTPRPV
ncbi:hypothetical protein KIPB_010497 [Kipferlia bialata]|uniref:Uncharacterized protein n=1 Tax=Kipferlia bialata TaxID=797122 RepID=A0A391NPK5_9EUKA|nr:hypothetical protein KIPB_010497 [Kipferlia bialata]|eukprot:g10497.t1